MKKLMAAFMAMILAFSLAACGGDGGNKDGGEVDMSAYPADINEWTGQNFIDYFTAAGVCEGCEPWTQDHASYWPGTPVDECAGWWDDAGMVNVMIFILSPDNADTSQEQYDEWMSCIREKKLLTEEEGYMPISIDHLVGSVAFGFNETTVLDEDILERTVAAYENLIAALGVTPEW